MFQFPMFFLYTNMVTKSHLHMEIKRRNTIIKVYSGPKSVVVAVAQSNNGIG